VTKLANIKSAIKRIRTNNKKRALNQSYKSDMRTQIKHVEKLIEAGDAEGAKAAFHKASRKIDKAIQKGVIHRNNGNRHKARLAQKMKSLGA
jgi:small subunit ribosomal protein S20